MHTIKVSVYQGIVVYVNCVYWHDSPGDNDDFCVYSALNVLYATYLFSTMFMHVGTVSSPCQKLVKCCLLAPQVYILLQLYFCGTTGLLNMYQYIGFHYMMLSNQGLTNYVLLCLLA